jgi:CheY-like chemotaxis protein
MNERGSALFFLQASKGRVMTAGQGASRGVVLVVDDDPDVRETIVSMLEPAGFTVVDAASGRQALDVLERDPTIDILFTDVMMPGISGITLAKRALELRPALRVVLTSAYFRDEGERLPCLRKPFQGDELVRALEGEIRV